MSKIPVEIIVHNKELYPSIIPSYGTDGSAALDLRVDFSRGDKIVETVHGTELHHIYDDTFGVILPPNDTVLLKSAISIHIKDKNFCAVVLPRSGLGMKQGLVLGNLTGLIDSDYQGEVGIPVWNRGTTTTVIRHGDRIAQLMFLPVVHAEFMLVDSFTESTVRGTGGFGHTGHK